MPPLLAACAAAFVVAGGVAAARIGPHQPEAAPPASAVSQSWLCPHGGGAGWSADIWIANPGAQDVRARVTSMGADSIDDPEELVVPAGTAVRHPVRAQERAASTLVEAFGGRVAVGWVVKGDGTREVGVGAEPCTSEISDAWYTAEPSTTEGQRSFLVIQNPFDGEAVFDVALFTQDRPPIRDSAWTHYDLAPHRSVALPVGAKAPGEQTLGAEVDVRLGRVAVATLDVTADGGIRSVLAQTELDDSRTLPTAAGSGQSELLVFVPGEHQAHIQATQLSAEGPQPAGGITEVAQVAASVKSYPIVTMGPTSIQVGATAGDGFAAALRTIGRRGDDGATEGAALPAASWVVLPDGPADAALSAVVLVNTGSRPARVELRLLPRPGGEVAEAAIEVPPASVVAAPSELLAGHPQAAVLVTCAQGEVVALGAAASSGGGRAAFALGLGVPVK